MQKAEQGCVYQNKEDKEKFRILEITENAVEVQFEDEETAVLNLETINDSLGNGDIILIGTEFDPPSPEKALEDVEEIITEEEPIISNGNRPYRAVGADKLKANLERYRESLAAESDPATRDQIEITMDKIEEELNKRF